MGFLAMCHGAMQMQPATGIDFAAVATDRVLFEESIGTLLALVGKAQRVHRQRITAQFAQPVDLFIQVEDGASGLGVETESAKHHCRVQLEARG